MDKPTIHLTNWSSRKLHSGRVFTIMARPRAWEHGDGLCRKFAPIHGDETRLMLNAITLRTPTAIATYREAIEARWRADTYCMQPGLLVATNEAEFAGYILADGDTLCCACKVGADCHRRWAAPFLARAGWAVVLDGQPFLEMSE